MRYALLVYTDENAPEMGLPEALDAISTACATSDREVRGGVVFREALQPTSTATSLRIEGGPYGDAVVNDGPFAETKEQLAGFYVVDCEDLDEAIQWAARVPSAAYGTIEVRPVAERSGSR